MTVGIGLIGAGFMSGIHARAIEDATGARLVAVAGGSRAPALAAEHGVPHVDSVEALLNRADVDAVAIATPHTSHVPLTQAAAAAGKHVFIEKPMALDVAECTAMIDACRTAGVRLMVAHITRFLEAVRVAHDLVAGGELGDVRMLQAWRLVAGYPNAGWPLDPREGSAFLDWGSHGCDVLRWFAGASPELAFGHFTTYRDGPPAGLSGMATFVFPGDAVGHVWQSYEMPGAAVGSRARYVIVGASGVVDIQAYGQVTLGRDAGSEIVFQQPLYAGPTYLMDPLHPYFRDAFRRQIEEFVTAVRDGRDPSVSGEDGRAAVEMVQAVERASATGQAVRLPFERGA